MDFAVQRGWTGPVEKGAALIEGDLSRLIQKPVFVRVSHLLQLPLPEISGVCGGDTTEEAIGMLCRIGGGREGCGALWFAPADGAALFALLLRNAASWAEAGKGVDEEGWLALLRRAVMEETANIVLGGFLKGFSAASGMALTQGVPQLVSDTVGAILDELVLSASEDTPRVLALRLRILCAGRQATGHVLFVFDRAALARLDCQPNG